MAPAWPPHSSTTATAWTPSRRGSLPCRKRSGASRKRSLVSFPAASKPAAKKQRTQYEAPVDAEHTFDERPADNGVARTDLRLSVISAVSKRKNNGGEAIAATFLKNSDSLDTVLAWVAALPAVLFDDLKQEGRPRQASLRRAPGRQRRRAHTSAPPIGGHLGRLEAQDQRRGGHRRDVPQEQRQPRHRPGLGRRAPGRL